MHKRRKRLEAIVGRLEAYRRDPSMGQYRYAIDENILFLQAIRSPFSYLQWLFAHMPNVDGSKLLELTDFPEEIWDVNMHTRLIEMQRNPRVGLIEPLVSTVTSFVLNEHKDLVIANLGAGGMELDRQILERVSKAKHNYRLTIVSIDRSAITRSMARTNLGSLPNVTLFDIREASADVTRSHVNKSGTKYTVIMCSNDIFALSRAFPADFFDLIYHSLFRHHLSEEQKKLLPDIELNVAKNNIEFDGFRSMSVMIPQTIVGWSYPEFFNAEIFSNLRFDIKKDILKRTAGKGQVYFYRKTGFYLYESTGRK